MTFTAVDQHWMGVALALAERAERDGEVPVGAVLVRDGCQIGAGWNQAIGSSDATAHAEVVALREACRRVENYRLPGTVLYVTLEPCAMCAGALVLARVGRVVYGAADPRAGAAGSVLDVFGCAALNHRLEWAGGLCAAQSAARLRAFFRARREPGPRASG